MSSVTAPDNELVDDFEINTYEVPVQLELSAFDSFNELTLAVVETAAKSIVAYDDNVDEGNASYITTRVDFDEERAEEYFEDDEIEYLVVETETRLGILDD